MARHHGGDEMFPVRKGGTDRVVPVEGQSCREVKSEPKGVTMSLTISPRHGNDELTIKLGMRSTHEGQTYATYTAVHKREEVPSRTPHWSLLKGG